jgi:hypothetical protein
MAGVREIPPLPYRVDVILCYRVPEQQGEQDRHQRQDGRAGRIAYHCPPREPEQSRRFGLREVEVRERPPKLGSFRDGSPKPTSGFAPCSLRTNTRSAHRPRPSGCRSAHCGQHSSPIPAGLGGTPQVDVRVERLVPASVPMGKTECF